MRIEGYSALVTVAASGLGAATAKALAKAGARVALLDLSKERASQLALEIDGISVECDVSDGPSVERAIVAAAAAHGPARILVNCAGLDRPTGCALQDWCFAT